MSDSYFSKLERCLRRRGVPVAVARRLVGELRDHAQDAAEEEGKRDGGGNHGARFGVPEDFAGILVESYRVNSFAWRHPVISVGIVPLLAAIGLLATPFLLSFCCRFDDGVSRILWMEASMTRMEIMRFLSGYGTVLNTFATVAGAATVYFLARRAVCPLRYQAAASAMLSLIGFMLVVKFNMIPPLGPDRAFSFAYSVGLGFPSEAPLVNLAAGISPFLLFLLSWRRQNRSV